MKPVLSSALCVCSILVLFQLQVVANKGVDELADLAIPSPTDPETWNVWGETNIEDVVVNVTPVACGEEDPSGICFDLVASNPTSEPKNLDLNVMLRGLNGSEFARMGPMPFEINSMSVQIQLPPNETSAQRMRFEAPETANRLDITIGAVDSEVDPIWGGTVVAAFSQAQLAIEGSVGAWIE